MSKYYDDILIGFAKQIRDLETRLRIIALNNDYHINKLNETVTELKTLLEKLENKDVN